MLQLIGLSGRARTGKDTIADVLVSHHDFTKFSFSDALYDEVCDAFGVPRSLLWSPDSKEVPQASLSLNNCADTDFFNTMKRHGWSSFIARSPRVILQTWGTEYRRAQDPDYWIKKAALLIKAWVETTAPGESVKLVNTSVRFENEAAFIRSLGGQVWHVKRADAPQVSYHDSEGGIKWAVGDRTIHNDGAIHQLPLTIGLMLCSPKIRTWRVSSEVSDG